MSPRDLTEFAVGSRWIDEDGDEHLVLLVEPGRDHGQEIATKWGPEGKLGWWHNDGFFVRKCGVKHIRYVNLFGLGDFASYPTREVADTRYDGEPQNRIACVRVEFEEGQFDD